MNSQREQVLDQAIRVAVDIGSTVIKLARIGSGGELVQQEFFERDFESGIADQVESLLGKFYPAIDKNDVLVCSSANGGLRVGIVSLTESFSGAVLRNQVLSAGANPMFVRTLDQNGGSVSSVDILIIGGGIDCEDAGPLEKRIREFRVDDYRFGSLIYAGNRHLAKVFVDRFPETIVISNPLGESLLGGPNSVFEALRRAYLDDLVYKKGVSELGHDLAVGIRPTPEVVSRGFQRIVCNQSSMKVAGACLLFDVGGATTDLHYTVEIVRDDSSDKPMAGASIARYVFTDLGVVASRDSTLLQMRAHPRIYEFLGIVLEERVRDIYQELREGEHEPGMELLAYACLFLSLDRFAKGAGPGVPQADLNKVSHIILTGGATQGLANAKVARIVKLFVSGGGGNPGILKDSSYRVWIDGMTWGENIASR